MIDIRTTTQIGVRLVLISYELQGLNARSLRDTLLDEIIAYCVPRRLLRAFTVLGKEGSETHMRIRFEIDDEEYERQIKLSGDGLPEGLADRCGFVCGPRDHNGAAPLRPGNCPHMGKALELFIKLAKDKGLHLGWTVQFREKPQEMREKFNLGRAVVQDRTGDGISNTLTNSCYQELTMMGRVSQKVVPAE